MQVELAQLEYLLPRLTGRGIELSRLGGGIGTRGPGETKLEIDRRRIKKRIADLRAALEEVKRHRTLLRSSRQEVPLPLVSLVGYTNAGKSTLLNTLTGAGVLAEDRLFATLDPTTRRIVLPNKEEVLITDTVGFIQNLPHQLVAAFRATLEEVVEADFLLHVIDYAHPNYCQQEATVEKVLADIGAGSKPVIKVYNKVDLVAWWAQEGSKSEYYQDRCSRRERRDNVVFISALKGEGIEHLLATIERCLSGRRVRRRFLVPYHRGDIWALLHERGQVLAVEHTAQGMEIEVEIEKVWAERLQARLAAG